MLKIIKKHILISTLVIVVLLIMDSQVYAVDFGKADNFISIGSSNMQIGDLGSIGNEFSAIGSILTYIGAGILVGATAYMGILYLTATPEKQAKLKQQLIGLVVSAIVVFGAYGIWKIVVNFLQDTIG